MNSRGAGRRSAFFILGTSALAIGSVLASPATAQCAPKPTQANGTTTCSGRDPAGLRVTTAPTTVVVQTGAIVNAPAGSSAIQIEVPASTNYYYYLPNTVTATVSGQVVGGAQSGITLSSGTSSASNYASTSTMLALTIASGGSVSGSNALSLVQGSNSNYGVAIASIDNSGALTGTGGPALLASNANYTGFSTIINRAGGSIGGISGLIGTLSNAGTIDGAALSAITTSAGYQYQIQSGPLSNTGIIRSNATAGTVQLASGGNTIVNSGSITNTSNGAAINGGSLSVQNQAGGFIGSAGSVAINATSALTLTNSGIVTGNVMSGPSSTGGYYGGSTIDSTGGTINGSVTFGSADDTLVARYVGTRTLMTGVTGTIDGGAGSNTEQVNFTANTSVTTPIDLTTNFQRLGLAPASGVTVTLESPFQTAATVVLNGSGGSIVNRGTIAARGQALVDSPFNSGYVTSFSNAGTITGTGTGSAGISLTRVTNFSNSGMIAILGTGISDSLGQTFTNAGTITASGTAVNLFDVTLDNRGTIRSSGGTGAVLLGNVGYVATNSGAIQGASTGVDVNSGYYVTNSGTISASGTGVLLESYGALINTASGVVTGGTRGVAATIFNNTVVNAGVINGDVVFSGTSSFYGNNNRYISQAGGMLNGNLSLGAGDLLVTDLSGSSPGRFAGISGSVTAGSGAQLRYRVSADAAATLGPIAPFAIVGYELSNNAKLTLTTPAPVARQLALAGSGSVDLTANIAATNASAIVSSAATQIPGSSSTPATALSITSRGTITATRSDPNFYFGAAVSLGSSDSFFNAGTIAVTDRTGYFGISAISGGASVTNSGTIQLDGGTGINSTRSLLNTGTIVQIAGGANATGVTGVPAIDNRGTISVGGPAVQLNTYSSTSSTLTNSGTLASAGGAAVTGGSYSGTTINNLAGGTIRGFGAAIQLSGATFMNAGTAVGTVDLGYSPYNYQGRSYNPSTYVAAGGTIAGNLLFGAGYDVFIQTGDTTGVSGVIDGGAGQNLYGRVFNTSGTLALDSVPVVNFQDRLVQAVGASTTVTLTSAGKFGGSIYAVGTGSVVNQANVSAALSTTPYFSQPGLISDTSLALLTNTGAITGGVFGSITTINNSGMIGAMPLTSPALTVVNSGPLALVNSGVIAGSRYYYYDTGSYLDGRDSVSVANSGSILGGITENALFSAAPAGSASLINSGSITGTSNVAALYFNASSSATSGGGSVTLGNSGTIIASGPFLAGGAIINIDGRGQPTSFAVSNSGTISASVTQAPILFFGGSVGLQLGANGNVTGTITNTSAGTIAASGFNASALSAFGTALTLDNAGTISATGSGMPIAVSATGKFNNVIRNTGTITGQVLLGGGGNRVENAGVINGNVMLGDGANVFVQRGGMVNGLVVGGAGTNVLSIDANGGGSVAGQQFLNFARVQQAGTGSVAYSGAFGVNTIELNGGTISVASGSGLSTLGATTITGGDAGVSVVSGGAIAGNVTLGAGNDSFRLLPGGSVGGVVDAGGGYNSLTLALGGNASLTPAPLKNFQLLAVEGPSVLTLRAGAFAYDRVLSQGALQVAGDASLSANVLFGSGDNRLSVAGNFSGSVDGAAGSDAIEVLGGQSAFGTIGNVEMFRQSAGLATLSGVGNVGTVYLSGGRFIGLAGSTLVASQIGIDAGATFGSAGTVVGNVAVSGTLSPGASPGTMTVTGNVALNNGSVSVFELTPAVSDKLIVNGAVAIASGATLQLVPTNYTGSGALDLITASGGISGSFTNFLKPVALNGFLSQQANRLQFVSSFTADTSLSPQSARALSYTNAVLTGGQANTGLLAALPRLLTASGASSGAAFARITPEAYASAQQIQVENGLTLTQSARGAAFAPPAGRTGLFTFGELQGDWSRIDANTSTGASRVTGDRQGLLGGFGWSGTVLSVGAFAGYGWNSQRIDALDARTHHDGGIVGAHARLRAGGFELTATGAYQGGEAVTTRTTPDGSARARYGLRGWTGDLSASLAIPLGSSWLARPRVGGTLMRVTLDGLSETGSTGFALTVARRRNDLSFIDGSLGLMGGAALGARFHPFVSVGVRYQLDGREPLAVGGFGGVATGLLAFGVRRAEVVATGALGFDADLTSRLSVFASASGEAAGPEQRAAGRAGLRLRF